MKNWTFRLINLFFFFASLQAQAQHVYKNMSLLGQWENTTAIAKSGYKYSDIWGYANNGKEYAVIGGIDKIYFLRIEPTGTPTLIYTHNGSTQTNWREFRSFGNYIYAITDSGTGEGLTIFDVSVEDVVTHVLNTTAFFNQAHMLFIDEANQRLYVCGANTAGQNLITLDLSVNPSFPSNGPQNPRLLSNKLLPGGYIHDLFVKNNIVYANHGNNGLYIYNYTDPINPIELGNLSAYTGKGYSHSGWLCDNGAYIMCDETLKKPVKSIDVSDPTDINLVDTFYSNLLDPSQIQSIPHNPYAIGDWAYISYYHDGIQVFDVTNSEDIVRTGYYDMDQSHTGYSGYSGVWGVYPFLPSGKILGSDLKTGLWVLQLDSKCGPPSLMTVGTPTESAVGLDWNDRPSVTGTNPYKVRYKTAASTTWTEVTSPTSDLTLTSLLPATTYTVQVASQCPYGLSDYAKQYSFTTKSSALPVELIEFVAKPDNKGIHLTWKTASESNNSHFEIEKSQDGLQFTAIERISGSGNSSTEKKYYYFDKTPLLGSNYYRLKQVDFEEKITYSEIVKSDWHNDRIPSIKSISKQGNQLLIRLENGSENNYTIRVSDARGRVLVSSVHFVGGADPAHFTLQLPEIESQLLVLQISNEGNYTEVKKLAW